MANKVTESVKIEFNELYLKYKTYAEVARQTGFSASTVKKYIIPNFVSRENIKITKFKSEISKEVGKFTLKDLDLTPQEEYALGLLKQELML